VDELTNRLAQALETNCRLLTAAVAVKLAGEEDTAPQKIKYPRKDVGHGLAVCQGMTLSRTFGWTMGFGEQDHACPLPRVFMGHIRPDRFLEGRIAGFYQSDPEDMKKMEASYPRWPLGRFKEIWLSPITKCDFVPDLIVAYGSPAQVLTLIQGANYRHGPGINSMSSGRYGCASWIAGVMQANECTYMVPGPGERIFAGTQDYEMSFAVPYSKIDPLIEGLNHIRSQGAYRYPVPNLGVLSEPRIPAKYFEIDPDRDPL
jgi:uncharacterized protein (DUF169 family)